MTGQYGVSHVGVFPYTKRGMYHNGTVQAVVTKSIQYVTVIGYRGRQKDIKGYITDTYVIYYGKSRVKFFYQRPESTLHSLGATRSESK